MIKLLVPGLCLVAAYGLFFGSLVETYGALPAKVASHFDVHGQPNGWMSRAANAEILTAVAILIPGVVIGTMGGAGRIPVSFINLPHREYWLAPERRQAALATLLRYAVWFATANVFFLTGALDLIVHANIPSPHALDLKSFTSGVIAYLVVTAVWTLLLLRRFSRM